MAFIARRANARTGLPASQATATYSHPCEVVLPLSLTGPFAVVAGSVASRFGCRPHRAEATLSRELRTPGLPPTHAPPLRVKRVIARCASLLVLRCRYLAALRLALPVSRRPELDDPQPVVLRGSHRKIALKYSISAGSAAQFGPTPRRRAG